MDGEANKCDDTQENKKREKMIKMTLVLRTLSREKSRKKIHATSQVMRDEGKSMNEHE